MWIRTMCACSLVSVLAAASASAGMISTGASGSFFGDEYSYLFTISDSADPLVYHAVLTNTSPPNVPEGPRIDVLAFNMLAELGTDFTIGSVVPSWSFSAASGGVQFRYVGEANGPGSTNKLDPGESLQFDFLFDSEFTPSFDLWLLASEARGTGIGGGDDRGQVAVSFQTLGANGNDSDLLASNWGPHQLAPEPGTLLLLGTGLLSAAALFRRRR